MIPPTKPPSTTLYGPAINRGVGEGRNSGLSRLQQSDSEPTPKGDDGVVNRGWNFIGEFLLTNTKDKVV